MITIAITGVQGSGKTTLTANLQGLCRRRGLKTILVTEVADRCPHPLNDGATVRTQEWIWHTQLADELKARNQKPDVVLCDRGLMDPLCYLALVPGDDAQEAFDLQYDATHEWMANAYDYVCRMPLNETWLRSGNNPRRSMDSAFAHRVDAVMDTLIDPYINTTAEALITGLAARETF